MKPWLALSLVGAVAVGLVALARRPAPKRANLQPKRPPQPQGYPLPELEARDYANLVSVFQGRPPPFTSPADAVFRLARYGGLQHNALNVFGRLAGYGKALNAGFARRAKELPREWYFPGSAGHPCGAGAPVYIYRSGLSNLVAVDAWGVGYCGTPGDPLGLLVQTAAVVLPYIPGIGTTASAALQAAIAIGQGKSLRDVALAAIRGALPPQAQLAFDLGVAVASGESVDVATRDALLAQIPNGRETYNVAVDAALKAGVK